MLSAPIQSYSPKVFIEVKTENYTLSTAANSRELKELFQMRHNIFFIETGITQSSNLDMDDYDEQCDHIIIRSNRTGAVCGTYRLLSTEHVTSSFYSENEFTISNFLSLPGKKLELGRACIHPDHRNGTLKDLLWRGISEYIKRTNADILFGCSSVMSISPEIIAQLLQFFKGRHLHSDEFDIQAKGKYMMNLEGTSPLTSENDVSFLEYFPPLLKGYFLAGAKVYGAPALDKDFMCTDFFTVLFLKDLNSSFQKRYMRN